MKNNILELYAPLSGKTISIETIPDPVFAQKTIGDGISINPSSYILNAPCAGEISNIHSSRHALTIRTEQGIDILMHIGLDTVLLRGEGFDLKVKVGQTVKKGDPLIVFDPAVIKGHSKSLLTEIVITNMDMIKDITTYAGTQVTVGKDIVLKMEIKEGNDRRTVVVPNLPSVHVQSWTIKVKNPAGFHARPVAVLVAAAKQFSCSVNVHKAQKSANAKSLVAVMGLDVKYGDDIYLTAQGTDAKEAMKKLIPLIETGLGEDLSKPVEQGIKEEAVALKAAVKDKDNQFFGIAVSPGMVAGVAVQLDDVAINVEKSGSTPSQEKAKLSKALEDAGRQLEDLYEDMRQKSDEEHAAIFAAHRELLADPELLEETGKSIDQGNSAAYSWQQTINHQVHVFEAMKNELLAGRANDLRDVGKRVLRLLTGEGGQKPDYPDNAILIAKELTPSDTASLDPEKVVGFATVSGGASSHAAILARSLLLPAVSGLSEKILEIADGTPVLLDGTSGKLCLNPDENSRKEAQKQAMIDRQKREDVLKQKDQPAVTTDGVQIEVGGNIGNAKDAGDVVEQGGQGVGLLRSEFLFLGRKEAPSIQEQTQVYDTIAKTLGKERSLIVRTLDVGGDKPLPYMQMPKEDNPFLGVRGLRLSLRHPDIFADQIRCILQAAEKTKVRIMFPMLTTLDELLRAKEIFAKEYERLNIKVPVELGIMIEVPAAAVMADVLAPHVDFFSIGTNDLTQYTMAADRGNAQLSTLSNGLDPAVLRMIKLTVDGAEKSGKWVGVCGGLASDENAVPVLIGLGVKELSVTPASIALIKARIRTLSFKRCQKLAHKLISLPTFAQVQQEIKEFQANRI